MTRRILLSAFVLLCAFGQTPRRHVVILSIDGFAAYALHDPEVAIPNIRKLAQEGVAAEAMQPVNPNVTWPNHTTLVTGVTPRSHTVIYNGEAVRTGDGKPVRVEPHVPKARLVSGTTLYDTAHQAGLTTAEVDWVAVEKAATITWSFPEWPQVSGAIEREMIEAELVTRPQIEAFTKLPITLRDEIWTRAAEHILTRHKPNLLLVHLLTTDSVQHRYGARSLGAQTALALADARVGRLVEALKSAGIYDRTAFFVVSDHGFKTVKRNILPNALLKEIGLSDKAHVVPEGGTAMVYVTQPQGKVETLAALQAAFQKVEGISRILTPADFDEFGYPDPAKDSRMADLVLAASDGYGFQGTATGPVVADVPAGATPGSHGYLHTDPDMEAVFVAFGAGIRPRAPLGKIRSLDVAPTAARLLGIALPEAQGRVLTEILR